MDLRIQGPQIQTKICNSPLTQFLTCSNLFLCSPLSQVNLTLENLWLICILLLDLLSLPDFWFRFSWYQTLKCNQSGSCLKKSELLILLQTETVNRFPLRKRFGWVLSAMTHNAVVFHLSFPISYRCIWHWQALYNHDDAPEWWFCLVISGTCQRTQ